MNISKINTVTPPKRPELVMIKEDFNPFKALKSMKTEIKDVATFTNTCRKVKAPEPPKMELVKEDYNPFKLLKEIIKELFTKKA